MRKLAWTPSRARKRKEKSTNFGQRKFGIGEAHYYELALISEIQIFRQSSLVFTYHAGRN